MERGRGRGRGREGEGERGVNVRNVREVGVREG